MPEKLTPATDAPRDLIVLDTNVVLDWLVFRDPSCDRLETSLRCGRIRWVVTHAMRDELAHVLARGVVEHWNPDLAELWATWDAFSHPVAAFSGSMLGSPRCTDPDDQKFIDLGLQVGADFLLSRDRAVLKCAKRAHQLGLNILTPTLWSEQMASRMG